jgi:hypothetical protein
MKIYKVIDFKIETLALARTLTLPSWQPRVSENLVLPVSEICVEFLVVLFIVVEAVVVS